jgi:hypothetical protein
LIRLSISGAVQRFTPLVEFDGSVVAERTQGKSPLAARRSKPTSWLNLMHDIVTGVKGVQEAREYYGKKFADYRRKKPTPYMERLRFSAPQEKTADPDIPILSDDDLKEAEDEGRKRDK